MSFSLPLPKRILFLARDETSVRIDLAMLRALPLGTITIVTRQVDALTALGLVEQDQAQKPALLPDILLCDEQMQDCTISAILRSLGKSQAHKKMPILLFAGTQKTAAKFNLAGVSSLQRPYTQAGLVQALQEATGPTRPTLNTRVLDAYLADKATTTLTTNYKQKQQIITTSDLCLEGKAALQAGDLYKAEKYFSNALARSKDHLDAYVGMALVKQHQKDYWTAEQLLLRAAASAIRQQEHTRAKKILEKLPEHYQHGNIFVHEGISWLESGEFRSAALSFLDAMHIQQELSLQNILARACLFTSKPEHNLEHLCAAYERLGHTETAERLRHRLLSSKSLVSSSPSPTWLDNFPFVRDVLQVAVHTAAVWRQA